MSSSKNTRGKTGQVSVKKGTIRHGTERGRLKQKGINKESLVLLVLFFFSQCEKQWSNPPSPLKGTLQVNPPLNCTGKGQREEKMFLPPSPWGSGPWKGIPRDGKRFSEFIQHLCSCRLLLSQARAFQSPQPLPIFQEIMASVDISYTFGLSNTKQLAKTVSRKVPEI